MKVFKGFDNAGGIKNPVVTIGSFDGVHCGHMEILKRLADIARKSGSESVVVTFEPHPRMVLEENSSVMLITDLPEKILLLEKAGVDNLIIAGFTKSFSRENYHDFIKKYLVDKLHVHTLLVGYNHHFGHKKEGNSANLNDMAKEFGFEVCEMPRQTVGGGKVSSTVVRTLLDKGNMREANKYLGHSYFIAAEIGSDDELKGIAAHKLLPHEGEYPVDILYDDSSLRAIARIDGRRVRLSALGKKIPAGKAIVKFV